MAEEGKPVDKPTGYKDRFWIPRFWDGIGLRAWFALLVTNRFRVAPLRWAMAGIITGCAVMNSVLWAIQQLLLGRRIARTDIQGDPIFIVGHWRSGTTLLHELMVLDERYTYPNTYDCFAPNHFLISGWLFRPALRLLMPKRRPMDNMAAGWGRPQEDEFALCNMGVGSPYLSLIFPNHPPQCQEYFELANVPTTRREGWKRGLYRFLQCITVRCPRRIVLKSPPHTFRIKVLLEMFPRARFVHIVRDPYAVFPSTIKLWKRLARDQGLQVPRNEGLEEQVLETFCRMYEVFERDRPLLGPSSFSEVRYEDLVRDPVGQMQRVYEQLDLGEFDKARPALQAYADAHRDYQTNRFELGSETREAIARRWATFIEKYGY